MQASENRPLRVITAVLMSAVSAVVFALTTSAAPPDGHDQTVATGTRRVTTPLPEAPDQPMAPPEPLGQPRTSPAGVFQVGPFVSVQVNVNALGMNIVGDASNEPSFVVSPADPTKMAIAWRHFTTIASNFRQAGRAYSTNGGATWTFPGVLDPGQFRSDPVLDADAAGNFYYSSLSSTTTAEVFKSIDGGITWGPEVSAFGGDKQWLAVDDRPSGMGAGHVYQHWNVQFTCCPPGDFTRSINGAASFQSPVAIPQPSMKWGANDVGPDGTLYIAGATLNQDGHLIARSSNAMNPGVTPTFDFVNPVNLGGLTGGFGGGATDPNPAGLLGQVWIAADPSNANRVYMLASVLPPIGNPLDVMLIRSVNRGQTWSAPARVNSDAASGAIHWFGTLAVAPNGRVDAVWNDSRNTGVGNLAQLYYASSVDGGRTWVEVGPLTPTWNSRIGWPQQNKIGDYYHLRADVGGSGLAYAATFNGEQDVYFLRLPADCNQNGIPDDQDVTVGGAPDCNGNLIPDACEPNADCNFNTIQDICDIESGFSTDCNLNYIPDSCESSTDCDNNAIPDFCDIAAGAPDCNANNVPDSCDIDDQTSQDTNGDTIPDECEGACCECNGACNLTSSAICAAIFGSFQGIGSSCDDVVCGAPNDLCAQATVLPRDPVQSVAFDTLCATDDAPTATTCGNVGSDVWYQYKPPCTGTVRASLCGTTNFDSVLAVYGGAVACSCPVSATPLACGDDTCGVGGGPSLVTFSAIKDRCYLIRVAGWEGSIGRGVLNLSYDTACDALPPAVVWDPNDGANRALVFHVVPPTADVTADANPSHSALKVTMVDLQHPAPQNLLTAIPLDFTALDTRNNGTCSAAAPRPGHHCDVDADCRICITGNKIGYTCAADAECVVGVTSGVCAPALPAGVCVGLQTCAEPVGGIGNAVGGCARWVGPPQVYMTAVGVASRGIWYGSRLQCTPYYDDWTTIPKLAVTGAADLVPSSEYAVTAYASSCKGAEGACTNVSAPVTIRTRRSGDTLAPFNPPDTTSQPDGNDVAKVVACFKATVDFYKPDCMLSANVPSMGLSIGGLNVGIANDAFRLKRFQYTGPCPCPAGFGCASCIPSCPAGRTCQSRCSSGPHLGRPCEGALDCGICDQLGTHPGFPCGQNSECGSGGTCTTGVCSGGALGVCVDACGRCDP